MTQQRAPGFITSLNALRFFAAIAIVIFHYGRWSWPMTLPWLQPYVLISTTGVTFFFVLSGFIMVYVYGQKLSRPSKTSVLEFYRARVARIVPLYFTALLLMVWWLWAFHESVSLTSLILQTLFVQSWVPGEAFKLNFAAWTLSVEMMFYVLFPLLYALFLRKGWRWAFWMTGVIWFLGNALTVYFSISYAADPNLANIWLKVFPPLHLNSFLIGMLAAMWYQKSSKPISSWLVYASLAALIIYPLAVPDVFNSASHNGLFAPLFAVLIIAITQAKSFLTKMLSIKPLVIGGDISYGVYILQAPVYAWVYYGYGVSGWGHSLGEEGRFFIYLALLCIASVISFWTVERWGKTMIRGRKT